MVIVFASLRGGQNVDFLDLVNMSCTKFSLQEGPVTRWRPEDICMDNLSIGFTKVKTHGMRNIWVCFISEPGDNT